MIHPISKPQFYGGTSNSQGPSQHSRIHTIFVRATESKRLSGIKDLVCGLISFTLGNLVRKVKRIASRIFCSKKPVALDQNQIDIRKRKANTTINNLKNKAHIPTATYKKLTKEDQKPTIDDAIRTLRSAKEALNQVLQIDQDLQPKLDSDLIAIFEELKNDPTLKINPYVKKIEKLHIETLEKQLARNLATSKDKKDKTKEFVMALAFRKGNHAPKKVEHEFKIDGYTFSEKAEVLETSIAEKFLKQVGLDQQADFIKNTDGIRPSAFRSAIEAQGMITNGWKHALYGNGHLIESEYRSGAFAVHCKQIKDADKRLNFGIAQALPKVIASIKEMAQNDDSLAIARETKSFLHVETSLLSDEFGSDINMIKDMDNVLDHLRKKLIIRFEGDEEKVHTSDDGYILITLPANNKIDGEEFGVETLFFTQGVNENQSLGHVINVLPGTSLQDKINRRSLNYLMDYADKAARMLPSDYNKPIRDLEKHYSKKGTRKAKDLEGMGLIRDATHFLGGRTGIVCKSGKDRTGMQVSLNLANTAKHHLSFDERKVFKGLLEGISHSITGYNTGKPPAYAFNSFQSPMLPKVWSPPAHLCGSVES